MPSTAGAANEYKPNFSKILESLVFIAHKKSNLDHYQAIKLLYLADKEHLNLYGRPISYDNYFALPYGPVPSTALNLLTGDSRILKTYELTKDTFPIKIDAVPTDKSVVYILREALRSVDYDEFSDSDIEVLSWSIEKYGEMTFGQLYDLTHEHFAYKSVWGTRGDSSRVGMKYRDMIEEGERKAAYISEKLPFAANTR